MATIYLDDSADYAPAFATALVWLRWMTIAAMLIIALMWPSTGRFGIPGVALVLAFAAYNLAVQALQQRHAALRSLRWSALLDLAATAAFYALDSDPDGPMLAFFYLTIVCAAAGLSLRATLIWTALIGGVVAAIAPTLTGWQFVPTEFRSLSSHLLVLALVGVGTNLLTRRLAQEQESARQMRDQAVQLRELDRLRSEFISTISHELRTPLTANRAGLGMLELSAGHRLEPTERQLLQNARRNVERLSEMIDDLLLLNQIKAGTIDIECVPVDLRLIVTDSVSAVFSLIVEKHQVLEIDLPYALPVLGEARKLEQVLINLLINANRHTPPGTRIVVSGRIDGHRMRLSVCDDGPGIDAASIGSVFERFFRADTEAAGKGLGLAIAKAIVELHGGSIEVESERASGTTFHVVLPVDARNTRA